MATETSGGATAAGSTDFTCKNCGATTSVAATGRGIRCPFCGSEHVIAAPHDPNTPRAEALIPFTVADDQAERTYRAWLGEGFFRPRDLTALATDHKMRAVYVPVWECRGVAFSEWTASAGHNRQEEETYTATENGKSVTKTRTVTHTAWRPARGHHEGTFEREMVPASKGLPQAWLDKLGDFDFGQLRSFDPQFLLGREVEEPALDRTDARQAARERIEAKERQACAKLVPGDTQKDLRVQTRVDDQSERLLYLPVWMASFQYKGQPYRCVVNGQTGKIGGEAPVAKGRVALVVAAVAAVVAVIALVLYLT